MSLTEQYAAQENNRQKMKLYDELQVLRKLLWLRHGCPYSALYGDDGEMQCGVCMIDFKRMPAQQIEDIWTRSAIEKLKQYSVEDITNKIKQSLKPKEEQKL